MNPSNPTRIHVLVLRDELPADRRSGEHDRIEQLLANEPGLRVSVASAGHGAGSRAARQHLPDVIVLDGVQSDAADLVAELEEAVHGTPLLVILDELERERANDCVAAGAQGCLVRPVDPQALAQTILQVHRRTARLRKHLQTELHTGADKPKGGRLIAVRGAKGGVGSTVIATNLAVAIKRLTDRRVALVDAHLFTGDVPVALNLVPERGLADLVPHLNALDDDLLASSLAQHASGVAVLAAPAELERVDTIRPEAFQQVLQALRTRHDYVLVDCSPFLDPNSLTVLDLADLVLLVSTPEVAALKNAGRFLQVGAALGYSEAKLRLVINRLNSPDAIGRAEFERHLEYRMSFGLPNDQAVVRALVRGEPLVSFQRTSRAARALERLARTVVSGDGWEGEPTRRSSRRIRLPSLRSFAPRLSRLQQNQEPV